MRLYFAVLLSFCFNWRAVSKIRDRCSLAIQAPRISLKILRCTSYFQLSSRCLDIPMKHCLSCLIYYKSTTTTTLFYLLIFFTYKHFLFVLTFLYIVQVYHNIFFLQVNYKFRLQTTNKLSLIITQKTQTNTNTIGI